MRGVEVGAEGGRAVGGEAAVAGACDGANDAGCGVDLADYVAIMVGEVQVSVWVESDGGDGADACFGCGLSVAGVAWESDACDGADDARCGVDLADACCAAIADVEVVVGVVCDGRNGDEVRIECWATVAFVPLEGSACDVVDDSVLVDTADVSMSDRKSVV